MPVLAIDTSDAVGVAVLGDDGGILAVRDVSQARRHAELLAPMISAALAQAQVRPNQLDYVAVGTGPAPFTGLRVGLVSAQTFAFAAQVPVYGVSTLDAIAQHASIALQLPVGTQVLVAMDAKRREVYFARYCVTDDGLDVVAAPDVATAAAVVTAGHATGAVVVGAGAQLYRDIFEPVAQRLVTVSDAAPAGAASTSVTGSSNACVGDVVAPSAIAISVGKLVRQRLAAGVALPVQPLYLRRPDAQEPAARKRAS